MLKFKLKEENPFFIQNIKNFISNKKLKLNNKNLTRFKQQNSNLT